MRQDLPTCAIDGQARFPQHALDRRAPARAPKRSGLPRPGLGEPPRETLCCASCHRPVTSAAERLVVAESHVHSRRNPLGIEYTFGCFADAPGCRAQGADALEYTWFPGYAWRVAVCGGCGTHLGWRFSADSGRFFALIVTRLKSVNAPGLQ